MDESQIQLTNNNNNNDPFAKMNEFVAGINELIDQKKSTDEVFSRIFDNANEEIIKSCCMDLLTIIGLRLNVICDDNFDEWLDLENAFCYIVKISSSKESLLTLLNLLEQADSDPFFEVLLKSLKQTFLRLPSKRGETLLWALNGIYEYIYNIPLPGGVIDSLEKDERAILENSVELNRLQRCVSEAMIFCEPLASEAKECQLVMAESREEQTLFLCSFLMKLLEKPASYFYFDVSEKNTDSDRKKCVEKLITMMFDLKPNFFWSALDWMEANGGGKLNIKCRFVNYDQKRFYNPIVGPAAIGILASFIWCYGIRVERTPMIYTHEYFFERLLPYLNNLLKEINSTPLIELALQLAEYLADRISASSSIWESKRIINEKSYQDLFLSYLCVITYAKLENCRRTALKLFERYLRFFEPAGQMLVIRFIFHVISLNKNNNGDEDEEKTTTENNKNDWPNLPNKGICGYLIDYYRSRLNEEILGGDFYSAPFFTNLPSMLGLFMGMRNREETDLLDNFDQYMASLNLIRFLCLVHINGCCTKISRQLFARASANFVEPMKKGLELSKAHYELDLKNTKETVMNQDDQQVIDQKVNFLKSAVNSFDLMMLLAYRVEELLNTCLNMNIDDDMS